VAKPTVGRQKKWSEELSEYQTQLVHRPSRTIAKDERTTQEYHGLQMNSIEWSHKSMMEERTKSPQVEPYPGYIFKPLESRAILIMREILRWDFSVVTNQIWKVTTALIPRIVSQIRSSSKRVPPKDTEAKVKTTKVEPPKDHQNSPIPNSELVRRQEQSKEMRAAKSDLLLVKRANRSAQLCCAKDNAQRACDAICATARCNSVPRNSVPQPGKLSDLPDGYGVLRYNFRLGEVVQIVQWSGLGAGQTIPGLYEVCTLHTRGGRGVRRLYPEGCMGRLLLFWPDRIFKYEPWITGKFVPLTPKTDPVWGRTRPCPGGVDCQCRK
jgi:hypothetical protein